MCIMPCKKYSVLPGEGTVSVRNTANLEKAHALFKCIGPPGDDPQVAWHYCNNTDINEWKQIANGTTVVDPDKDK